MKWDQAQSSLIWKKRCPFVPLLFSLVSPPGRRRTRHLDALLRVFTHIAYKMGSSAQSSLLPPPPTCVHASNWIYPYCHDSVSFCITISSPRFLPLFYCFSPTRLYVEGEGGRNWTLGPWIRRTYADGTTHFLTLQVHRLHLPHQIFLHTPSDLGVGGEDE